MWRPDGWKCKYLGKKANRYYELGAVAMLEALRKKGQRYGASHNPFTGEWIESFTQVNIPEEEE